jgi:hypothetical protein
MKQLGSNFFLLLIPPKNHCCKKLQETKLHFWRGGIAKMSTQNMVHTFRNQIEYSYMHLDTIVETRINP